MQKEKTKEIVAISIIILFILSGVFIYSANITGNAFLNFNNLFSRSSANTGAKFALPPTGYRLNQGGSIGINNCTVIDKPGNYVLTKDLSGANDYIQYGALACVYIPPSVSDVFLNCNNYTINLGNYKVPKN